MIRTNRPPTHEQPLESGDTFYQWCNTCQSRTLKVYGFYPPRRSWMTCLSCHPDAEMLVAREPVA